MKKRILSIIAGIIIGFIVVMIGDAISQQIYPTPEGLEYSNKAALEEYITGLPTSCFIFMLMYWLLSSFLGGLVAARINSDSWERSSIITGIVLLVAAISNMVMVPFHPLWMMLTSVALYVPFSYFGGRLVSR